MTMPRSKRAVRVWVLVVGVIALIALVFALPG